MTEGRPEDRGERQHVTEGARPGAGPDGGPENGTDAALERRLELVEHVDRLEDKLQRSRLSAWVWMMATLYFIGMGFYTGNWPPAGFMASVCAILSLVSFMIRQSRRDALHEVREEMEALSGERGPPKSPGRIADGEEQASGPERD